MGIQESDEKVVVAVTDRKELLTNCRMVVGMVIFFIVLFGAIEYHFEIVEWIHSHPILGWPSVVVASVASAALVLRLLLGCGFCKETKYCPHAIRRKKWGRIRGVDEQ